MSLRIQEQHGGARRFIHSGCPARCDSWPNGDITWQAEPRLYLTFLVAHEGGPALDRHCGVASRSRRPAFVGFAIARGDERTTQQRSESDVGSTCEVGRDSVSDRSRSPAEMTSQYECRLKPTDYACSGELLIDASPGRRCRAEIAAPGMVQARRSRSPGDSRKITRRWNARFFNDGPGYHDHNWVSGKSLMAMGPGA